MDEQNYLDYDMEENAVDCPVVCVGNEEVV